MNKHKFSSKQIRIIVVAIIAISFFVGIDRMKNSIPDEIKMFVNDDACFNFAYPIEGSVKSDHVSVLKIDQKPIERSKINLNLSKSINLSSDVKGKYTMQLKLFGIFPLKSVNVDVIDNMQLTPCGMSIGIYVETDGVLVLGTSSVPSKDSLNYEPALNILKSGDYIIEINNKKVVYKTELIKEIQNCNGKDINLKIRRNNEVQSVKVSPVLTPSGEYKIGTWIRDNTQGIGTMTFIDQNNNYGALGHSITDIDTNLLMQIGHGSVYTTDIMTIVKGKDGTPGEIVGMIYRSEERKVGSVELNTSQGIFGTITNTSNIIGNGKKYSVGLSQDVKVGPASILSDVSGSVKEYNIEIEKIEKGNKNKGMVLRIVDPELLAITNGIVQGMSGSPILQEGKIIGAVTHVFVHDSTKGYGTFVENMLKTYN